MTITIELSELPAIATALVAAATPGLLAFWRFAVWYGGLKKESEGLKKELKWQSEWMVATSGKVGTIPPPRRELMTLDDPMEAIEEEARVKWRR